jgi:uncharacterized membrane protein YdbT with pleckstrin-like domain
MDLQPGETVIYEGHPSWRSVLRVYVLGILAAVAVGAVVWLVTSLGVGVLVAVVGLLITLAVGYVHRRGTRYVITTERLHIRKGILSRHEQHARLSRVQDVATHQSFFERVLQIGTVDFETAAEDEDDFRFAGVDDPRGVVAAVERAQRGASLV